MIDHFIVDHGLETNDDGDVILTTSHARETLDHAVWFAMECAESAPARPQAESTVIACIGPPTLAEQAQAIADRLGRPSPPLPKRPPRR